MLGEKLMQLRKKQGYSQQDVANLLSVSRQTISNWELNIGAPSLDKAKELADLYHISLNDLVEDEIEIITTEKTQKHTHILQNLIGKQCKVDCDDLSFIIDNPQNGVGRIVDVNDTWVRIEYERKKDYSLTKKETVIKLIDISTIYGFTIMEDEQ